MPIFNTFAKRKRAAENAEKPVIYTQDHLPEAFRTQAVWILRDLIGFPQGGLENQFFGEPSSQFWQQARDTLAAEFGKFYGLTETVTPPRPLMRGAQLELGHRIWAPVGSPAGRHAAWWRGAPFDDTGFRSTLRRHPRTLGRSAAWRK